MRRFRLLDAMILVAATAVGCAGTNVLFANPDPNAIFAWRTFSELKDSLFESRDTEMKWMTAVILCGEILAACAPIVAAWGVALIALRWIGPRPRWRRLAREPGIMACCASTTPLIVLGGHGIIYALGHRYQLLIDYMVDPIGMGLMIWPMTLGMSVLAAWMTLLLGGRWRAEPTWIDRLGRAIGVFWVVVGLLMVHIMFVI